MSNYVILTKTAHRDTKVILDRSEAYGDKVKIALTFPQEFRNVQACYPIFFIKDGDTGQFYPAAIFGFEDNENLFLTDQGWDATYIPMMIRRHPFLIGFQPGPNGEKAEDNPVVSIDMDNPRVNGEKGEALFTEEGNQTPYLEGSIAGLEAIHLLACALFAAHAAHADLAESSLEVSSNHLCPCRTTVPSCLCAKII